MFLTLADPGFANGGGAQGRAPQARGSKIEAQSGWAWRGVSPSPLVKGSGEGALPSS